jgi:predicted DNA-binding ribbon-helix-helix protein
VGTGAPHGIGAVRCEARVGGAVPVRGAGVMSTLISRNVTLAGRRTSLRMEQAVWHALEEIAQRENWTLHALVQQIDRQRHERTLTAGVRVYVLQYFRAAATEAGHAAAGHGRLG